jgi:ABC-2 type transport system permease protein
MNTITILSRELLSVFYSPLGWTILTLFLLVQGYAFYLFVELVNQPQAPHGAVMQYFFGGTMLYWLFVIFIVATITMRSFSAERSSGTIESLMTNPVTEVQAVLGKYLAAVLFYVFLWVPTLVFVALVAWLSDPTPISWGAVGAGYLGTLVVGAACIAVGILASAMSRRQILAAVLTCSMLSLLLLFGVLQLFVKDPALRAVLAYINLFDHMEDFSRGIVDSRHLVLHGSVICFCLVAAVKTLERRKWR